MDQPTQATATTSTVTTVTGKETFSEWFRRMVDAHHDVYVLMGMAIFGSLFTLHVAHHAGDKELVQFGREMTIGSLTCLFGFLKGVQNGRSQSQITSLNLSEGSR